MYQCLQDCCQTSWEVNDSNKHPISFLIFFVILKNLVLKSFRSGSNIGLSALTAALSSFIVKAHQ